MADKDEEASSGGDTGQEAVRSTRPRQARKTAKTSDTRRTARAKATGDAGTSVPKAVEPIVEAATDVASAVEDGAATVARTARKAAAATRRGTARARKVAADAPTRTRKAADTAVKRTASAASSRTATTLGVAAMGLVAGVALNLGRKAAVQAPSALTGDWFAAVKAEHAAALLLFDRLQKTSDSDGGKRSLLLTQLKHALAKHAFMEENVLYPALRDWGDKADADKLNHDHGYVKQYLYDLENMDNGSQAFLPKVAEFRAQIEEHMREEEDAIFPPLHAALGTDKNAQLTAQANKEAFKLA